MEPKRGQHHKKSGHHPFVALEHRVIDSAAFADLKHSSIRVLLAIARQLTRDNNGRLQCSFAWCKRFGIGSTNTLADSIADLIAHGFIYRTKSHGANGVWAQYAVTWLPINKPDGLFLGGFKMFAWREWVMPNEKSSPRKLRHNYRNKCELSPKRGSETATSLISKTATYEPLVPCYRSETATASQRHDTPDHDLGDWIHSYLNRLAAYGLADACPVRTLH